MAIKILCTQRIPIAIGSFYACLLAKALREGKQACDYQQNYYHMNQNFISKQILKLNELTLQAASLLHLSIDN
jgi:hypothetical protein